METGRLAFPFLLRLSPCTLSDIGPVCCCWRWLVDDCIKQRKFRSAGIRLTVPSSLTGAPLTYFCPHPLRELAGTWVTLESADTGQDPVLDPSTGVLLARYLMRYGLLRHSPEQPFYGFDSLFRPINLADEDSLVQLWRNQTGRTGGYRNSISYSGGFSPSTAAHIYPPHQEIDRLVADMCAFFVEDWRRFSAMDVIALILYYSVSIHPFPDGNGRWARQVTISAAARAGNVWQACVLLSLYAGHKERMIAAWRDADEHGLEEYLRTCRVFQSKLAEHMADSPIAKLASDMHRRLVGLSGQRDANRLYCAIMAAGMINEDTVSKILRCSGKKARGVLAAMCDDVGGQSVEYQGSFVFDSQLNEFFSGLAALGWPSRNHMEKVS